MAAHNNSMVKKCTGNFVSKIKLKRSKFTGCIINVGVKIKGVSYEKDFKLELSLNCLIHGHKVNAMFRFLFIKNVISAVEVTSNNRVIIHELPRNQM